MHVVEGEHVEDAVRRREAPGVDQHGSLRGKAWKERGEGGGERGEGIGVDSLGRSEMNTMLT